MQPRQRITNHRGLSWLATIFVAYACSTALALLAPAQSSSPKSDIIEARKWIVSPDSVERIEAFAPAAEISLRRYTNPRPLRAWIARIDLTVSGVRFALTRPAEFAGVNERFETRCADTLEFARQRGVQLAVNTSAFAPFRERAGQPMDVVGLAAVRGRRYSDPDARFGAMYISRDGRVSLKGPPLPENELWQVIPGFRMLVDDGEIVVSEKEAATKFGGLNPRTAAGVARDGRTLWLIVADGRRKDWSMGLTLVELAALFQSLGVWDALNLDGGGSSLIVMEYADGKHAVMNTPSGGAPRQVANNLGLYLPGRGAAALPACSPRDAVIQYASSKRGGGYIWKGDGVSTDIVYDGARILRANPQGTYSRGATLEAFLHAYCGRRLDSSKLPDEGRWFENWPREKFVALQKGWYGDESAPGNPEIPEIVREQIRERRMANVLPWTGMAAPVTHYRMLQRGDFVQFWRKNESGHSAVFWGRDFDEQGRERLWYWSSQGKPRHAYPLAPGGDPVKLPGYGVNWEYIGEEIDPARIYGTTLLNEE